MNGFLFPVISNPAVNFLDGLSAAMSTLTPPFAGGPINNLGGLLPINSRRYVIRAISYVAVQNIGLEFDFYSSATVGTTPATTGFVSRYQFTSANGAQYNGANDYLYYVDGLAIPYIDLDTISSVNPPLLHVGVQNVDTVAKSANAAGAIQATFWLEAMQGW